MTGLAFDVEQKVEFQCVKDRLVGACALKMGETLRAESDGMGGFFVYTTWGEGPVIHCSAKRVNELAGEMVVQ